MAKDTKLPLSIGNKLAVLDFLQWLAANGGGVAMNSDMSDREMKEYAGDTGLSDLFDRFVRERGR